MLTQTIRISLLTLGASLCCYGISLKTPRAWELELLEGYSNYSTQDVLVFEWHDTRINRTHRGLSGKFEVKVPLTDDLEVEMKILRSESGTSKYQTTLMHLPKAKLTEAMQKSYKPLLLPMFSDCAPNAYNYEGDFVAPFPVCSWEFKNCIPRIEALPRLMPEGYYRMDIIFTKQVELYLGIIAKVTYID